MKLYSAPGTCATAIHIALEWIGEAHEVEHVGLKTMKSPDYLKLNPAGVVPTFIDSDQTLVEAAAILLYLTDKYPGAGLGPAVGAPDRQELYRWLTFLTATLHPYFWPHFMPMRFTTDPHGHDAVKTASRILVDKALTVIDQHLEGREWLVGDTRTVADALLYPLASWAYAFEKSTAAYANIDRVIRKLASDPAVIAMHEAQGSSPKVERLAA
ncbi:MAG: glutathione S-transferase family protein [Hyphomicrobiales bacterium]|nr:glutathione S-transferase family protein [Hyphomicrobiales bacterium]